MRASSLLMVGLAVLVGCQPTIKPRPTADFTFAPVAGTPGRIQFTNTSKDATRFQWTFGDSQASTEENPVVTYRANGIFTVKLLVRNNQGEDEVYKSVEISDVRNTGTVLFWTNGDNGSDVEVFVNNTLQGIITTHQATAPACGADGYITVAFPAGTYSFYAKSRNRNWSGTFTVRNGECTPRLLGR